MASWAYEVLSEDAPKYKTGDTTKSEYSLLNALAQGETGPGKQVNAYLKQYNEMGDFDPQKSAYYKNAYHSLKQVYRKNAKHDMQNALASAAANTGGYGNSYATTAANNAYAARLEELAQAVPNLYKSAADEYANRKNQLATLIGMLQEQQRSAIDSAQFRVNTQQALDAQRYQAAVEQDRAQRDLAKFLLSLDK